MACNVAQLLCDLGLCTLCELSPQRWDVPTSPRLCLSHRLEWCGFTSYACHAIASMLGSHRKLMYLDLSKNVIGVSGILTLSLAFLSHRQGEDVIL